MADVIEENGLGVKKSCVPVDRFNARVEQIIELEGRPVPDTPPG